MAQRKNSVNSPTSLRIPDFQSMLSHKTGNCSAACISSLLTIDTRQEYRGEITLVLDGLSTSMCLTFKTSPPFDACAAATKKKGGCFATNKHREASRLSFHYRGGGNGDCAAGSIEEVEACEQC